MFRPFVLRRSCGELRSIENLSLEMENVRALPPEAEVGDASGELDMLSKAEPHDLNHRWLIRRNKMQISCVTEVKV